MILNRGVGCCVDRAWLVTRRGLFDTNDLLPSRISLVIVYEGALSLFISFHFIPYANLSELRNNRPGKG